MRWVYRRASWTREHLPPLPTLATAREAGLLGVDLNGDHMPAARIDASGTPSVVPAASRWSRPDLRDARLREAITALLDLAEEAVAGTIVADNVNVTDPTAQERATASGCERPGRRCRGYPRRRSGPG